VKIRDYLHKPLKRLHEENNARGLPPEMVEKLRKMLTFFAAMNSVEELKQFPGWRAHLLTGDRKGTWSLIVTRNWRVTFTIDDKAQEVCDIDYEDYH
jgi:proteic killer suppression protein